MTQLHLSAAAAVLSLLLTACAGDGAPEAESTFTPTATPTPRTTPTAPPADEPSAPALGPQETVEAWVAARNAALSTGDISRVVALSSSSCETCLSLVQPIADIYAAGGYFETDGWRVVSTRVKSESPARAEVPAALVYAPGVTVVEEGADPNTYDEVKRLATFKLRLVEGVWRVSFLGFLS